MNSNPTRKRGMKCALESGLNSIRIPRFRVGFGFSVLAFALLCHIGAAADEPPNRSDNALVQLGADELFAGIPGDGALSPTQIHAWLNDPENHEPLPTNLPLGLAAAKPAVRGVAENALTRAKIELGRQLFFEKRLSGDGTVNCASCHNLDFQTADNRPLSNGMNDRPGSRNSPAIYNRIVTTNQFWDGRASSLEEQAKSPITNAHEMGNTAERAVATIEGIDGYRAQFDKIFPDEGVTLETIAKALATFERALVTGPAPYDYLDIVTSIESQLDEEEIAELEDEDPALFERYAIAKKATSALPASVIRGTDLFFSPRARCATCHSGANFTDEQFYNLGVGTNAAQPDLGRFELTDDDADRGAFKTPTLRNVAMTAPYMHDGSHETLLDVVELYSQGGIANPHLSDKMRVLNLDEQEKRDLVDFMVIGLQGSFPRIETNRLPE